MWRLTHIVRVSLARNGRRSTSAVLAAAALCSTATAFDGRCILQVRGKTYLNSICNVEMDENGSFSIGAGDNEHTKYFAFVRIEHRGVAQGFWNGVDGESHADEPLGRLTRDGSCWVNRLSKVCAVR
jgi:hypothetical protein